jgi:hypothetical protein
VFAFPRLGISTAKGSRAETFSYSTSFGTICDVIPGTIKVPTALELPMPSLHLFELEWG